MMSAATSPWRSSAASASRSPSGIGGVGQQRVEPAAELGRAVDGQRTRGEPVEGVVAVDDAAAPGGVPGELQRGLDRLGAAVAEEHPVQAGRLGQQPLREQARQRPAVELGPVGQLGVERVVQRLADHRVVAARGEHAEAGQEIGVLVALGVVQVRALGPLVDLVEADRVQHLGLLRVQVPAVQLISVAAMGREQGREVEVHDSFSPGPRRPVPPAASGCPTRASDSRPDGRCSRRGLVRKPAPQQTCMTPRTSGTRIRTPAGMPPGQASADRGDPGQVAERDHEPGGQPAERRPGRRPRRWRPGRPARRPARPRPGRPRPAGPGSGSWPSPGARGRSPAASVRSGSTANRGPGRSPAAGR